MYSYKWVRKYQSVNMYVYTCIYIYVYIHIYVYMYLCAQDLVQEAGNNQRCRPLQEFVNDQFLEENTDLVFQCGRVLFVGPSEIHCS